MSQMTDIEKADLLSNLSQLEKEKDINNSKIDGTIQSIKQSDFDLASTNQPQNQKQFNQLKEAKKPAGVGMKQRN